MFGLTSAKLAKAAHLLLFKAIGVPGNYMKTSLAYRKVLISLANTAMGDVTLKRLKQDAGKMSYFHFRNRSDLFANAIWEAREKQISDFEASQEDEGSIDTDSSAPIVDNSTDTPPPSE
jgi:hypothetical protein